MSQDYSNFTLYERSELQGEALMLYYVPLHEVALWDKNPKRHDIGAIITSIKENGFKDPPTYDSALDALVEGNGRTESLQVMFKQGEPPPRGILVHKDEGYWCVPVLFGIDAKSRTAAERYAIDHNNLTMMGGEFTAYDMMRMWDRDAYLSVLQGLSDEGSLPISVDFDDLNLMLTDGFEFEKEELDHEPEDAPDNDYKIEIQIGEIDLFEEAKDSIIEFLKTNEEWKAKVK